MDIRGVTDYGAGEAFLMSETNYPTSSLALIQEHFGNPKRLAEPSRACHEFAVERLDWRLARTRDHSLYEELLQLPA